jgi:hypothetical protein
MKTAMRQWVTVACVAAVMIASACIRTSPSPRSSLTERVLGDNVSLYYGSAQGIYGELLAVTDSSFILMRGRVWSDGSPATLHIANESGVVIVPRRAVSRIEFGLKRFDTTAGMLNPQDIEQVVHRARFPYGLTAEALATLLRESGQTKADTVAQRP